MSLPFRRCQNYVLTNCVQDGCVVSNKSSEGAVSIMDTVQMAEPIMVNPNSYTSVREFLEHMQEQTINSDRPWTIVGSDGVPYVLDQRLRVDDVSLHNLLLVPGPGHF